MYTDQLSLQRDHIAVQEGELAPTTLKDWIQPFVNRLSRITCVPMDVYEDPFEGNGASRCRDIFPHNAWSDTFYNYRCRYYVVRQDDDWRRLDSRLLDIRYNLGTADVTARVSIHMDDQISNRAVAQTYPYLSVTTAPRLENTHMKWVIRTMLDKGWITHPRGYAQALIEIDDERAGDIQQRLKAIDRDIKALHDTLRSRERDRDSLLRDLYLQG